MKTKMLRVTTLASLALLMLVMLSPMPVSAACAAGADYRSKQTGNWGNATTWECFNGSSWEDAASAPDNNAGVITVQNGHTVTVAANVTADQVVVETGGQVTINSGITWTIADGTGTDLSISGTVLNQGTFSPASGSAWTLNAGATFIHNTTTGIATPLGRGTLNATSNFVYRGSSTLTPSISISGRTYGNLMIESTSGLMSISSASGSSQLTINGNFSIGTTGAGTVFYSTAGYTGAIGVAGNFSIGSGSTFTVGSSTMTLSGNCTNDGTLAPGSSTFVFGGTSAQTIGGSGTTAFNNLTINNSSSVTLSNNATVNGTLTLTSGDLNTGSNTLTLGSAATVAGTGDVVGNVQRAHTFSTGTNYQFNNAQTLVNFNSVTNGASPSVVVNLSKSAPTGLTTAVPRVYSITPNLDAYDATLQLGYKDSETGGMTEANLRAWRYDGSRWVLQAGSVDTTNNYVSATNVTAFSNWAITDNGAPSAVTLSTLDARADTSNVLPFVGLGALALIALGVGAWWRRK